MAKMIFTVEPKAVFHLFLSEKMKEFEPTGESDYIYENDRIIRYIGTKKRPEIPQTLDGVRIRVIGYTAFSGCDITAVYIPDGVGSIE